MTVMRGSSPPRPGVSPGTLGIAVLVLGLPLLAGCGLGGGGSDPSASAVSAAAPAEPLPQVGDETTGARSVAADDPPPAGVPQGGRLRGLMAGDIDTWDGTAYDAYAWMVDFITCNTLVGYPTTTDEVANLQLRPELAAAMPEISDDERTYAFTVRPGVRFSDGREVTAEDVKGTFLRMLDPAAQFPALGTSYFDGIVGVPAYKEQRAADIAGIATAGDRVTFTLREPDGGFLNALALQFACVVPADAPRQQANLPPPMTGPYMVTGHGHDRSLTIDRNPVWRANVAAGLPEDRDTNNVDGFDVTIGVPPQVQVLRIKSGEADFSFDSRCCVGAVTADLAGDPALEGRFHSVPTMRLTYATFNVHVPPFDDVRVRQAANYAVDREALVKIAGGPPQGSPTSGLLPDTMVPTGVEGNPYPSRPDLDRARALLAEAGVETPLDAGTLHYAEDSAFPDYAQQIASDLARAGIRVRLKGREVNATSGSSRTPRNVDPIALVSWEADYPDAVTYFGPLLAAASARGGSNYGDFEDPSLDAELARINALPPGPERGTAYAELSYRTAADQAPWLTLFTPKRTNLVSERYGGYHYGPVKTTSLGLAYVAE